MKSCVKCAVDELVWFAKVHVTPLFTKVCLGGIDSCSYNDWRAVFHVLKSAATKYGAIRL